MAKTNGDRPRLGDRERPRQLTKNATADELERGLAIDEHALERCCQEQAALYYDVISRHAALKSAQRDAKRDCERAEALVLLEIREQYEKVEKKDRPTVDHFAAFVTLHPKVIKARDRVDQISADLDEIDAFKDSYSQRKEMLQEMVSLWLGKYYADPVPGGERRFRDITADRATEKMRQAYRRRNEEERG